MADQTSIQKALATLDGVINRLESALKDEGSNQKKSKGDQTGSSGTDETDRSDSVAKKEKREKKDRKKQQKKEKKERKEKKKQQKKDAKKDGENGLDENAAKFMQCNLRVGRVLEIGPHPEAEALYIMKVGYEGAEGEVRNVCAGLRKFVPEDQLQGKLVVTITNLKPRTLRGVRSEAMILAGSVKGGEGDKEVVKPVIPPEGAKEGNVVGLHSDGEDRELNPKNVSAKAWDKVVALLRIQDGKACFDTKPMTIQGSPVLCDLPDGSEIH